MKREYTNPEIKVVIAINDIIMYSDTDIDVDGLFKEEQNN